MQADARAGDEERIPGGSSGGPVISVVKGMALGSLGTDTRASIRLPPAFSGGVGVRPSRGLVPVDAWCTPSWTIDRSAPYRQRARRRAAARAMSGDSDRFGAALPGDLSGRSGGPPRCNRRRCRGPSCGSGFEEASASSNAEARRTGCRVPTAICSRSRRGRYDPLAHGGGAVPRLIAAHPRCGPTDCRECATRRRLPARGAARRSRSGTARRRPGRCAASAALWSATTKSHGSSAR